MKKPSVTQLLDLVAKPALIGWANRLGLQGIDIKEKRRKSLAKGSSLHEQIMKFSLGTGDFEDDFNRARFIELMDGKTIVGVEQDIETDWFVGRYDAMICDENGECVIVDYKSGFKGKVYMDNKLQLIAYTMAAPASMAIVALPQFKLIPVEIINRKPYEEMLIKLAELFALHKEIKNA